MLPPARSSNQRHAMLKPAAIKVEIHENSQIANRVPYGKRRGREYLYFCLRENPSLGTDMRQLADNRRPSGTDR
jgi:hypothetical protein